MTPSPGRPPLAGLALLLLACLPAAMARASCAGSTQSDLDACAAADRDRADAAMNAAYGALVRRIGPRAQEGLRAAQRAWLSYRDATCALESMGVAGGSAQPMVRLQCLAQVTAARTKVLDGYLACPEGDLSCVGRFGE